MAGSENGVSGVLGKLMPTQSEDSGAPKKKMSRQKARLARRDAAAAQMRADAEQEVVDENNQEAADEAKALKEACDELDVTLCEVRGSTHPDCAGWALVCGRTDPVCTRRSPISSMCGTLRRSRTRTTCCAWPLRGTCASTVPTLCRSSRTWTSRRQASRARTLPSPSSCSTATRWSRRPHGAASPRSSRSPRCSTRRSTSCSRACRWSRSATSSTRRRCLSRTTSSSLAWARYVL